MDIGLPLRAAAIIFGLGGLGFSQGLPSPLNAHTEPHSDSSQEYLTGEIYPGAGPEDFRKWAVQKLGKKDPSLLGPLIQEAQRLAAHQDLLETPLAIFLKNTFSEINTSLILSHGDTLCLYMGKYDSTAHMNPKFRICHAGHQEFFKRLPENYQTGALTLRAKAFHKAKALHKTYIEGNNLITQIFVGDSDSTQRVHFIPVTPRDSIGIGGGLRTRLSANADSILESVQLHMEYNTYPVDKSQPFRYAISSISEDWTEVDLAQYLFAQKKLDTSQTLAQDLDSSIVKFILTERKGLWNEINGLKNFQGFRKDLLATIGKIQMRKEILLAHLSMAEDVFSLTSPGTALPKKAYWKNKVDSTKDMIDNIQSYMEKNLKNLSHEKSLNELELFSNVWNTKAPTAYSFVLKRKCFCGSSFAGPFVVEIEDKEVSELKHMKGSANSHQRSAGGAQVKNQLSTITHFGAFTLEGMIREVNAFIQSQNPHIVEIDYNETYGYPNRVYLDPNIFTTGDELTISIGALHIPE